MEVIGDDSLLQAVLSPADLGGIDNSALDFKQLEDYLNDAQDGTANSIYFEDALIKGERKISGLLSNKSAPSSPLLGSLSDLNLPSTPNSITQLVLHSSFAGEYPPIEPIPAKLIKVKNCPSITLPESPPDSGSEPSFSPGNGENLLTKVHTMQSPGESLSHFMIYNNTQPLKHLPETTLTINPNHQLSSSPQVALSSHSSSSHHLPVAAATVPSRQPPSGLPHQQQITGHLGPALALSQEQQSLGQSNTHIPPVYESNDFLCEALEASGRSHKKRKLSDSDKNMTSNIFNSVINIKQENGGSQESGGPCLSVTDDEYSYDFNSPDGSGMFLDSAYQCIRFQPFQQNTWNILCDRSLKELPPPNYRVDADKGFNFSNADDAFVCQKKNHFQVTVHIQPIGEPRYVKVPEGIKKIDHFLLQFNGVKVESLSQTIKVEQSQSDRSKKPFHPVILDLNPEQVTKTTVGRLHFSETTSNNMRKKGKPNPDQRYFYLVVSLCAISGDQSHIVISHASERIIVRASNPGQFENDMELSWQRGHTPDSIYHAGRVGINTDRPDESLVIHGNLKITGHIVQPSDVRAKTNIEEVDTREQLKNVANMRIVRYQYLPEFAQHVGLDLQASSDTGIIAQDVQKIIPEAVKKAGNITLPNGHHIEDFLVVNKERIFMENVGAVKELCKVTDNLETRIDELEKVNKKLNKIKRIGSVNSVSSASTITRQSHTRSSSQISSRHNYVKRKAYENHRPICTNHLVQGTIILLVLIMAFCLIAMASLYILEWQKRHHGFTIYGIEDLQDRIMFSNKTFSDRATLGTHSSENEKQVPVLENSINSRADKEENCTLDDNDESLLYRQPPITLPNVFAKLTSTSPPPQTIHSIPNKPYYAQSSTLVPILKPRSVGTPLSCRITFPGFPACDILCCSPVSNQLKMLYQSSEEIAPKSADNTFDSQNYGTLGRSMEWSLGKEILDNNAPMFDSVVDHRTENIVTTSVFQKNPSPTELITRSIRHVTTTMPPTTTIDVNAVEENEENSPQFNQIKHCKDTESCTFQWLKVRADKNSEGQTNKTEISKALLSALRATRTEKGSVVQGKVSSEIRIQKRDVMEDERIPRPKFFRKDLPKAVESVKLLELNSTIGQAYCNTLQCTQGIGPRFSYHIPISKYMKEEYVTLQFNLALPLIVDHCEPDENPVACPTLQQGAGDSPHAYIREQNLTEEDDPSWRIPIGLYLRSAYRFRIQAQEIVSDTPCSLPNAELGHSFIEFMFVFQRKCDK